ncbi:MAG: response regulator [Candidatus Omnitrophica bacterium]|nr:response regulator [Candidatus Omnitrophota bacterium]
MSDEKKVLIVDDEPDAIAIAETMLSEVKGITTLSETSGEGGLAKAKETKPDLVILDIQMPGKSGFEVFTELQKDESTKGIPVIMLTGVQEKTGIGFSAKEMKNFLGKEPDAYIEKPVDALKLQKTVSSLLGL